MLKSIFRERNIREFNYNVSLEESGWKGKR